jgi:PAS domain S-box-containing protein
LPTVPDIKRHPTGLILSFLALLLVVPLLAYSVVRLEGPRIRHEALADLSAIDRLKAEQIESWLAERHGNAEMLRAGEGFVDDVARWFERHDPVAESRISSRLAGLRRAYNYRVELLDARVHPVDPEPGRQSLLAAALGSGRVQMSDLYRDSSGQVWLDLVVPLIKSATGKKVGAVVLHTSAKSFLFPLIQTWPTPSPSAETLLCRRDGDWVLFLNELRHRKETSLTLRLPLDSPDLPAAIAARSGALEQTIEGHDYRGIPVLAAARPIKGTPWFLLAKVDQDEVMRPLYKLVTWVSAVAGAATLSVALILLLLWRQQQRSHRLELLARTGERDRLLSLFYDLPFMGMAIIDPDDGHWLHVNDRLCELLGYSHEELLATTTWKQVTHPDDLANCMAEYRRMLAGATDGYRLEKRFLRKDGGALDVALVAKCVRRPDGSAEYIVKTIRDISEQKRLAEARAGQQRATGLLTAIAAASTDAIYAKDTEGNYLFCNNEAAREVDRPAGKVVGSNDSALYPPGQAAKILARDREIMAGGEPVTFEETLTTVDGERIFLTTKGPLLDSDGRAIGLFGISRDITERKFAEDRLRRNQAQLQVFIEHAPISIAMFDRTMNYLAYSRRWLEDYGRGCEDLSGHNHYEVHPDLPDEWKAIHRRCLAGETLKSEADHWIQADGSERWLRWAVLPWRDAAGSIGGIIMSAEDITERRRIEQELSGSRARLAGIINSAMDAIVTLDEAHRVRLFNPAAERMFDYKAEEMIGESIDRLIPGPLRQAHTHHLQRFAEAGMTSRDIALLGELRALRRDGTEFPIEASISKSSVAGERLLTAILRDVSERKQAEEALRASEERFRSLVEQAADGIFVSDARGFYLDVNSAGCAMLGYTREEVLRRNIADVVDPAEIPRIGREVANLAGGAVVASEWRFRRKDGSLFPGEISARQLADGRLQAILRDITERKAAEEALRYQLDLTRSITEKSTDSIFLNDAAGRVTAVNPEAERMFGYPAEELVGRVLHDLIHHAYPDGRPYPMSECPLCHVYRTGEVIREHEAVVFRKDGTRMIVTASNAALESGGKLAGSALVLHDITAIKQAEQALREADQRKDEFLAMLAHELRNPLAPIRNAAHVLGRLDLNEPRVRWAQDIIERQVAQLTHLVDELLDVSRIARGKVSLKKTRFELADLVRQACESVQPLMSAKGHRFEVRVPETNVMLEGDIVRLVQVLQNLLNNAAKYTPDAGHIELVCRRLGREVEIQVRDDGMGIPADLLPGVFDLFRQGERTLDRSQGGLGIGLTLVRRLVELHGGRVEAHSAGPGLGSTFTVRLPAADDAATESLSVDGKPGAGVARLRVLVVDDDPVVAESMVVFLEMLGHQVRSADSGEAALHLLAEFRPRVVLLDIGLPGQDGYEVARRIRRTPGGDGVKLVAVSGYGQEEAVDRSREAGFDRHLVKPVDPEDLGALLAEIGNQG